MVRLADSNTSCSGRVEFYYNHQWGSVCDTNFGTDEADVICGQLDCGRAASVHGDAYFGEGYGPIWLDKVDCTGSEASVTECSNDGFATHSCDHGDDVGVICEGEHTA